MPYAKRQHPAIQVGLSKKAYKGPRKLRLDRHVGLHGILDMRCRQKRSFESEDRRPNECNVNSICTSADALVRLFLLYSSSLVGSLLLLYLRT